jgi:hypothetical protein
MNTIRRGPERPPPRDRNGAHGAPECGRNPPPLQGHLSPPGHHPDPTTPTRPHRPAVAASLPTNAPKKGGMHVQAHTRRSDT